MIVTYKQNLVNNDMEIKKLVEPGDVLNIQFKINLDRDLEYVVHDKQMALDMMFQINS